MKKIVLLLIMCLFTNCVEKTPQKKTPKLLIFDLYMDDKKKRKIMEVLNVFETGSKKGNYSAISIYKDGPNDSRQITYGRSQTTESGNLKKLVKAYAEAGGEYSPEFEKWVDRVGKRPFLVDNKKFLSLLEKAGEDPVMKEVQDNFFDETYWKPAKKFYDKNNFKYPLTMLVVYDSYIHSGWVPSWLRERFDAKPSDEKEWVRQYVKTRHEHLLNHRKPILRKTVYRTKAFLALIEDNNWNLDKAFVAHGRSWEAELSGGAPDVIVAEESEYVEQNEYTVATEVKLPSEDGISKFYSSRDHLVWFSFPTQMRMPNGQILESRKGDSRSDYVCHTDIKERLEDALQDVFDFLGEDRFRAEGWDIFGGGFDAKGELPERLGLIFTFNPSATKDAPHFTDETLDIMEHHGFLNLGRATGSDFGTFVAYVPNTDRGDYYRKLGIPNNIK